jgi:hypothetical protein
MESSTFPLLSLLGANQPCRRDGRDGHDFAYADEGPLSITRLYVRPA